MIYVISAPIAIWWVWSIWRAYTGRTAATARGATLPESQAFTEWKQSYVAGKLGPDPR